MIKDFEPKSKDVISSFFYQEDDDEYTYEVFLGTFESGDLYLTYDSEFDEDDDRINTLESKMYLYVWRSPDSGYVYVKAVNQLKCKKIQELIEEEQGSNKNNKKLFETIKGIVEN
jgi:hypothetical protein